MKTFSFGLIIVLGFVLQGCTATDRTRDGQAEEETTEIDISKINWSRVEDFDAEAYPDSVPEVEVNVKHEVPTVLMAGKIPAARTRATRGYRIQVTNTVEKTDADRQVARLIDWWRSRKRGGASGGLFTHDQPPVYTVYRQPYYRVRIGNFSSRDQADRALAQVSAQFPGALVVPDQVSVNR